MRQIGIALTSSLIAAAMLLAHEVYGQTTNNQAELFERGVRLMNAGNYAEACPLIQQSYDLEPKDGRLHTLAACREGEGKLASALMLYRKYLHAYEWMKEQIQKKHAERAEGARKAAQKLEVQVPRLKMVWQGDVPKDAKVTVDGVDALVHLNKEWPLDPGKYYVVAECCGYRAELPVLTLESGKPTQEVDLSPARWASESYVVTPLISTASAMRPALGIGKFYVDVGAGLIVLPVVDAYWGAFMGKIGYERKGEWGAVKAGLGIELTYVQSLAGVNVRSVETYAPGIAARPMIQYRWVEFRPALGYAALILKSQTDSTPYHFCTWGLGMKFKIVNHLDAFVDFNVYGVDFWSGFAGVGAYF